MKTHRLLLPLLLVAACDRFDFALVEARCRADGSTCSVDPDAGRGGGSGGSAGGAAGGHAGGSGGSAGGTAGGSAGGSSGGSAGGSAGGSIELADASWPTQDAGTLSGPLFVPTDFFLRAGGVNEARGDVLAATQRGLAWSWVVSNVGDVTGELLTRSGTTGLWAADLSRTYSSGGDLLLVGKGGSEQLEIRSITDAGVYKRGWFASAETPHASAVFFDAGAPRGLIVSDQSSGAVTARTFDIETLLIGSPSASTLSLCDSPAASVRDSAIDAQRRQLYVTLRRCRVDAGFSSDVVLLNGQGALEQRAIAGEDAVVGVTPQGAVWVASTVAANVVRVERRDVPGNLGTTTLALDIGGINVEDLVASENSVWLIGHTSGGAVTFDGGQLVPPFTYQLTVFELDTGGALKKFSRLDTTAGLPLLGGSVYAHGRVWVSGNCSNIDGGFCSGPKQQAMLIGIAP